MDDQPTEDIALAIQALCRSAAADRTRTQSLEQQVVHWQDAAVKAEKEKQALLSRVEQLEAVVAQQDVRFLQRLKHENARLQQKVHQRGFDILVQQHKVSRLMQQLEEQIARADASEKAAAAVREQYHQLKHQLASLLSSLPGGTPRTVSQRLQQQQQQQGPRHSADANATLIGTAQPNGSCSSSSTALSAMVAKASADGGRPGAQFSEEFIAAVQLRPAVSSTATSASAVVCEEQRQWEGGCAALLKSCSNRSSSLSSSSSSKSPGPAMSSSRLWTTGDSSTACRMIPGRRRSADASCGGGGSSASACAAALEVIIHCVVRGGQYRQHAFHSVVAERTGVGSESSGVRNDSSSLGSGADGIPSEHRQVARQCTGGVTEHNGAVRGRCTGLASPRRECGGAVRGQEDISRGVHAVVRSFPLDMLGDVEAASRSHCSSGNSSSMRASNNTASTG